MSRLNLTVKQETQDGLRRAAIDAKKTVSELVTPDLERIAKPFIKKGGNRRKGDRI